jgi:hypothetical protein
LVRVACRSGFLFNRVLHRIRGYRRAMILSARLGGAGQSTSLLKEAQSDVIFARHHDE